MQNGDGQQEKHCVLLQLVGNLGELPLPIGNRPIKALTGN